MSEQQGQPKNAIPPQVVYYLQPQEVTADDEISLLDLWRVLVSYKWLIVSVTLLTTAIATAIAFYLPPVYRAEVTLAPVTPEEGGRLSALAGELGGIASLAGINIGSGGASSADKAIAVLESRAFTDAFIKDEQLLPVLFSDIWDPQKKVWLVEDQKDTPTLRKAYQVFDGSIRTVKQDKKTGLITLIIEWKDPVQAARWANLLVERLNQHERQEAIAEAEKSLAYLKNQLSQTSILEIQQSIFRLIEAQTKNIMLASARDQYALSVVDPAVVPEGASKPQRRLIVILGAIFGLALGITSAFFIAAAKDRRCKLKSEEYVNR